MHLRNAVPRSHGLPRCEVPVLGLGKWPHAACADPEDRKRAITACPASAMAGANFSDCPCALELRPWPGGIRCLRAATAADAG